MPIPDKGFFDTQQPTDSLVNLKIQRDEMREQADEQAVQRAEAEQRRLEREAIDNAKAREQEDEYIKTVSLISDQETRENLMARIQSMRAEPYKPPPPPPLTERAQQRLKEEQEAGRQAIARHQEQQDYAKQAREKAMKDDVLRQATLTPVHTPNPTMDERFPVNKSTIDGPGGVRK